MEDFMSGTDVDFMTNIDLKKEVPKNDLVEKGIRVTLKNGKDREIFESFDTKNTFIKDKRGNYKNHIVHNLWVGFKNWLHDEG